MRQITKIIPLKVNEETMNFRLTRLDAFLFLPVAAGMWKQHELWDGTYTLDDLLDAIELIAVKRENEMRAREAAGFH